MTIMPPQFEIHDVKSEQIDQLQSLSEANGSYKDANYWDICAERMLAGRLSAYIAFAVAEKTPAGYVLLNWTPKYRVYKALNIPEIQDLNVISAYRRNGLGQDLVRACEGLARSRDYQKIGVSFGLTKDYGAAQRLYCRLGYVPDGFGVTYDREPVNKGDMRSIDDDLCLMLVKELSA